MPVRPGSQPDGRSSVTVRGGGAPGTTLVDKGAGCRLALRSRCTSRRRCWVRSAPACRSAPTPPGCCIASGWPVRWAGPAWRRWPGISGAGTTAAPCCAPRWPDRSRPPSASPGTSCIVLTCWPPWPTRCPPTGSTSANGAHAEVEVLVGADGIHSAVRSLLFGPQDPHFTGCVAYRGLVPGDRLADLRLEVTAQLWMGPGDAARGRLPPDAALHRSGRPPRPSRTEPP
jgi:hypothetical protein